LLLLDRTTGLPLQLSRGGGAGGGRGGDTEFLLVWLTGGLEDCEALLLADRGALLAGLVPALLARGCLWDGDTLLGGLDLANLLGDFIADMLGDRLARLLWDILTDIFLLSSATVGRTGLGNIGTLLHISGGALLLIHFTANIFLNVLTNILTDLNALLSNLCLKCNFTDTFDDLFTFDFIYRSTKLLWCA